MGRLNVTVPASTRYVDLFYTDAASGAPSTKLLTRDLGATLANARGEQFDLAAGQDPAGRRFATKNRDADGASGLSNVATVPGGGTPPAGGSLHAFTRAYVDAVDARRSARSSAALAAADVATLDALVRRLSNEQGELSTSLLPLLVDGWTARAAQNVGGGDTLLSLERHEYVLQGGASAPAWTADGLQVTGSNGSGAKRTGGLFTGQEKGTMICLSLHATRNSSTGYIWSQYPGSSGVGLFASSAGYMSPVLRPNNDLNGLEMISGSALDGTGTCYDDPRAGVSFVWKPSVAARSRGYDAIDHQTGVIYGSNDATPATIGIGESDVWIGNRADGARPYGGKAVAGLAFSDVLSDADRAAAYQILRSTVGAGLSFDAPE